MKKFFKIFGIILLILAGGFTYSYLKYKADVLSIFNVPESYYVGSDDANIIMVEILDYSCNTCREFDEIVQEVLQRDSKIKLLLVPVSFPEEREDTSRLIAHIYAAAEQGKIQEMHEKIIKEWPLDNENMLFEYARELGLNIDKYKADLERKDILARIEKNKTYAKNWYVKSLPTFIIAKPPNNVKAKLAPYAAQEKVTADIVLERINSLSR